MFVSIPSFNYVDDAEVLVVVDVLRPLLSNASSKCQPSANERRQPWLEPS